MRRWRITSWFIVVWTVAMTWLAIAMLSNPELRRIDVLVGAVILGTWWLAGLVPLSLLWIVAYARRRKRTRHEAAGH
jgi:hypothetical protein